MARIGVSVLVVVLMAVAGCSKNPASAPAANPGETTQSPTPTATATAAATASLGPAAAAPAFTADGVGPYLLGAKLSELQAAGLLAEVRSGPETCLETAAHGTGLHEDVALVFGTNGILRLVVNRSPSIPASSGARIGDTLATLRSIYGSAGQELTRDDGAVGYLVTAASGRGILFSFDDKKMVYLMVANDASKLKRSFLDAIDGC